MAVSYTNATKYGSVIGRINTARKFQSNGNQAEVDAYPSLSTNSYAYLNIGFSPSSIFPSFRSGFDYNRSLPKSFEMSAGIRFLKFTSADVYIFTGHLGKYYGNYWFSARPYVTPSNTGTSVSGQFIARRYLSSAEHYLSLQIGYGTSPDDRIINLNPDLKSTEARLKAKRIKLEYTQIVFKYWNYNIGLAYENEEWRTNTFRDVVTVGFGLSRML